MTSTNEMLMNLKKAKTSDAPEQKSSLITHPSQPAQSDEAMQALLHACLTRKDSFDLIP